jgi:hypothetical protein
LKNSHVGITNAPYLVKNKGDLFTLAKITCRNSTEDFECASVELFPKRLLQGVLLDLKTRAKSYMNTLPT